MVDEFKQRIKVMQSAIKALVEGGSPGATTDGMILVPEQAYQTNTAAMAPEEAIRRLIQAIRFSPKYDAAFEKELMTKLDKYNTEMAKINENKQDGNQVESLNINFADELNDIYQRLKNL